MDSILALDTTVAGFTLALQHNGAQFGVAEHAPRSSSAMHPALVKILEDNAIQPNDIEILAITVGPGSFTGCRIGMAFAEAWRLAQPQVKVVGLPTLAVLALQVVGVAGAEGGFRVLLDAAGGQVYGQDFTGQGGAVNEPFCAPLAEAVTTTLPIAAANLPLCDAAKWHIQGLLPETLLQAAHNESLHVPLEIAYLKPLNYQTKAMVQGA